MVSNLSLLAKRYMSNEFAFDVLGLIGCLSNPIFIGGHGRV